MNFIKAELTDNAKAILEHRYLKRKENGELETPEEMFWRVAQNVAQADALYGATPEEVQKTAQEFYEVMAKLEFLPNSPCLRGAGRELQQLAACFVLPIEDDLESIMDTLKHTVLIHKTGGGTGFSFSNLRPKGDIVSTTGNVAGGPVSFMRVFSNAAKEITQGGVRMGGNMAVLSVTHPDIEEFITCKKNNQDLMNFNLSVSVIDEFMELVKSGGYYWTVNPRTNKRVKELKARDVFDKIAKGAWANGEPGILFIDTVNQHNPTPDVGKIEATNVCGEQPLLPYESCVLGSINLSKIAFGGGGVNLDRMGYVVKTAIHFLDNVIDVNNYVIPEIENITKNNRKVGLGIMGLADILAMSNVPYNSDDAIEWAKDIMHRVDIIAKQKSIELAEKRGTYISANSVKTRNSARTSIAPNGTIGIIADCNGGIEPFFALAYQRKTLYDATGETKTLTVINKYFERVAKERGFYSDELMRQVAQSGSIQHIDGIPDDIKQVFVTAHDITPEWHIKMQSAFQEHVDSAISKTINMPNSATVQDVKDAYMLAWKLGCKGVTVYRDGCRESQVLNVAKEKPGIKGRQDALSGITYKSTTPFGNAYVTVNENGYGQPFEVFINIGKAGSDVSAFAEALGRLISLTLRLPSDLSTVDRLQKVLSQMLGIGGGQSVGFGKNRIRSLPDAIGKVLEKHLDTPQKQVRSFDLCPDCGQTLILQEGCQKCLSCGYSAC